MAVRLRCTHPESERFEHQAFTYLGIDKKHAGVYQNHNTSLTLSPGRVILPSTLEHKGCYYYHLFCCQNSAMRHICMRAWQWQFFFLIEKDRPVRMYADFEWYRLGSAVHCATEAEFAVRCRHAVTLFCAYVQAVTSIAHHSQQFAQWFFYSATTASKFSIHAHCDSLSFRSVAHINVLAHKFEALLRLLRPQMPLVNDLFDSNGKFIMDTAVYTSRPFRLPLNAKDLLSNNHLLPLDNSSSVEPTIGAEHMAHGFLHVREASVGATAMDARTETRRRINELLNGNNKTLSMADLLVGVDHIACSVASMPIDAELVEDAELSDACARAIEELLLRAPNSSASSTQRANWLRALSFFVAYAACNTGTAEQACKTIAQAVATSFEFSVASTREWRIRELASTIGIKLSSSNNSNSDSVGSSSSGSSCRTEDVAFEFVFSVFYIRAKLLQDKHRTVYTTDTLATILLGSDEVGELAIGGAELEALYDEFERTVPAHYFFPASGSVSLHRMGPLGGDDPLAITATPMAAVGHSDVWVGFV